MAALSIPKLNYYSALHRQKPLSANVSRPPLCFAGKIWLHHHVVCHGQICKVTENRDDKLERSVKFDSKAKAPRVVINNIEGCVDYIKSLLSSMDDGRISVSAYDTAWVALIEDINGRPDIPKFPDCLAWIAQHQLPDGSWGDQQFYSIFDRLVNTLACVLALRFWNVHVHRSQKGISFIRESVNKLENAEADHMTCGFEVVFPALLQRARDLGIHDLPYDASYIKQIYVARDQKMKRIPKDVMHGVPTTLLFSLEALDGLNWEKLLKLQETDGSFFNSPSSTAFAFMETADAKCLKYISNIVENFGGAPNIYPVDTYARLWAVDRLQRLGVSCFFEQEIEDCLTYIYRYWTHKGISYGRNSKVCDIDDTSMGFRLLRLNGYDVNPNVFRNFKSGDKFECYGGEINDSPSSIFNLYRASQIQFPGENILHEANKFSYKILLEKLTSNVQILDKWVISEHLSDEIRNGLELPWYASLPRVESRLYLEHYSGSEDVWIGKTLYRMEEISNDVYLELGKLYFRRCQTQYQLEWFHVQEWYENCSAQEFGMSGKDLLHAYFLATASIFQHDRSKERLAWTKSQIICRLITSFLNKETIALDQKESFVSEFKNNIYGLNKQKSSEGEGQRLANVLLATLRQFLQEFNGSIRIQLRNVWIERLEKILQGESYCWGDAELMATTLNICAGHAAFVENILSHPEYRTLCKITNKICYHLSQIQNQRALEKGNQNAMKPCIESKGIEGDMQELVKLVLERSVGGMERNIKQTFLTVVKTLYYTSYNAPETIHVHILKVLFEPLV